MPLNLGELLASRHTAVLTMEMQRGVCGDLASVPTLAEIVRRQGTLTNAGRLVRAARSADVRVVHCTAEFRADFAGSTVNCPMIALARRHPEHLVMGTPSADVVPELGPEPEDLMCARVHGMSPFAGTSLDIWLRNLGVSTVVAPGVSLNVGVLGMVIEAVNLGYQVVVPTDAVAGVPAEYAEAVLNNTISVLATRTTVDEIIGLWSAAAA
jgi:nicotinamidase-related amidase